jgi:uncharacterized protein (TIGR03083 family)
MEHAEYLRFLERDVEAFAQAVETGPLTANVAACPPWDLADLARHLGGVHRWARIAALTARRPPPDVDDPAPEDPALLAGWVRDGGARLVTALADIDLAAPTWHPFTVLRVGEVWPRRQAQETSVHRWDAEHAIGRVPRIDPALAADGIAEYFRLAVPRLITREGVAPPDGVLAVTAADTGDRWLVHMVDGALVVAQDAEASAELSGPAEQVLLALWRRPVAAGTIDVSGDEELVARWLQLGGL